MTTSSPAPRSRPGPTRLMVGFLRLIVVVDVGYAVVRVVQAASASALHLSARVQHDDLVDLAVPGRPGLPDGVRPVLVDHVLGLSLTGQSAALRLLDAVPDVIGGIGVAIGALLLSGLVRDLGRGDVFTARSVRSTNLLAVTVLATGWLVPILRDLSTTVILDHNGLLEPGLPFTFGVSVPFAPVVLAVLLGMLANTWRLGARMRDDLEGLV